MKFTTKTKDYQLVVKAKAAFRETIDLEYLERFAQADIQGFFKPKVIKKRCVEYMGIPGMSLSEYLRKPASKEEFFLAAEQLVSAAGGLWERGFSIENLVPDISHVYINEITREIQLIYLPTLPGQKHHSFMELMEAMAYAMISSVGNAEYLSRFIYFLRSLGAIQKESMEKLEQYIKDERRIEAPISQKTDQRDTPFLNENTAPPEYKAREDDEDDATFYEAELQENEEADEEGEKTMLLDDGVEEGEDFTELVEDDTSRTPVLYRISTGETIPVTKKMFRLGTEEACVDYAVLDNHAVSRSHADIICREDRYFVFDLGSKNKSYINNRALPSKYEVEISNGDILKLANEEFEFRLQD